MGWPCNFHPSVVHGVLYARGSSSRIMAKRRTRQKAVLMHTNKPKDIAQSINDRLKAEGYHVGFALLQMSSSIHDKLGRVRGAIAYEVHGIRLVLYDDCRKSWFTQEFVSWSDPNMWDMLVNWIEDCVNHEWGKPREQVADRPDQVPI